MPKAATRKCFRFSPEQLWQPTSHEEALLIERHTAEWFQAEAVVPGTEVHDDPDVTWMVQPGRVWSNAGIMVRFSAASAARRLDTLITRYRAHGRGMGLWISPAATPRSLPGLLRDRRLRCGKYFPAMLRHLEGMAPARPRVEGLEIGLVTNLAEFERTPHPSIGPITTPLRRYAFERLRALILARPTRTWAFVASLRGKPVGASLLFLGSECAGLHDLTVLDEYRGRGIGGALLEHTCTEARRRGASMIGLLASSDGQRLYERCGFSEVARFGYWYRSFQQGA